MTIRALPLMPAALRAMAGAALLVLAASHGAAADDAIKVDIAINNHRFQPAEPKVPAGKPITLVVHNLDKTPEEFESKVLKVEKIVTGLGTITLHLRPLKAGRYPFFGEYHEKTAQGALIVE